MGEGSQEHPEAKSETGPSRPRPRSAFDGWKGAGAYSSLPESRRPPRRANRAGLAAAGLALAAAVAYSVLLLERGVTVIGTPGGPAAVAPQAAAPPRLSAPAPTVRLRPSAAPPAVQQSPLPVAGEEFLESGRPAGLEPVEDSSARLVPLFAASLPAAAPSLRPLNVTGFADYETGPTGLRRTRIRQDNRIYFQTQPAQDVAGRAAAPGPAGSAARPGAPLARPGLSPLSRTRIAQQGRGASGQVPGRTQAAPAAQGFVQESAASAQGSPDCPACQDPSAMRSSQAQVPGHWGPPLDAVVGKDLGACESGRIIEIQNRSSGRLGDFRLTSDSGEAWNIGALNPGQSVRIKSQTPPGRFAVEFSP